MAAMSVMNDAFTYHIALHFFRTGRCNAHLHASSSDTDCCTECHGFTMLSVALKWTGSMPPALQSQSHFSRHTWPIKYLEMQPKPTSLFRDALKLGLTCAALIRQRLQLGLMWFLLALTVSGVSFLGTYPANPGYATIATYAADITERAAAFWRSRP